MSGAAERSGTMGRGKDLAPGAGETVPLSDKENFEGRPHLYRVIEYKGWSYVVGPDAGPWRYQWEAQEEADRRNTIPKLSKMDRQHLGWLAKQPAPMWGGHLKRGEPISDPDMARWIETGLIEARGAEGYVLTGIGHAAIKNLEPCVMSGDEQRNAVRQLGLLIGYDRVIELAQELARSRRIPSRVGEQ